MKGTLFILSSPSGGGKTTICQAILRQVPSIKRSISYTTRPARSDELDGSDYHYISEEEFDKMVAEGKFAEWAVVHKNRYGTPAEFLDRNLKEGYDIILTIDVQGARNLKAKYADVVTIFILPPSFAELKERLVGRGTEGEALIGERLKRAKEEVGEALSYDYIIVNEHIDQTIEAVKAVILAERARASRASAQLLARILEG